MQQSDWAGAALQTRTSKITSDKENRFIYIVIHDIIIKEKSFSERTHFLNQRIEFLILL